MTVDEMFDAKLNALRTQNKIDYYDQATSLPSRELAIGEMTSLFQVRAIAIGTRFGPFIAYQKGEDKRGLIHYQCSHQLDYALGFSETHLTFDNFNRIFHPTENVGLWLEILYQHLLVTDEK